MRLPARRTGGASPPYRRCGPRSSPSPTPAAPQQQDRRRTTLTRRHRARPQHQSPTEIDPAIVPETATPNRGSGGIPPSRIPSRGPVTRPARPTIRARTSCAAAFRRRNQPHGARTFWVGSGLFTVMSARRQRYLNQTFMRIPRRAENTDRSTLAETYVSAGSFSAMLHSTDHQVLYGRRGTGKTHALHHLGDLVESTGDLLIYLDLRTVGPAVSPRPRTPRAWPLVGPNSWSTCWKPCTTNCSPWRSKVKTTCWSRWTHSPTLRRSRSSERSSVRRPSPGPRIQTRIRAEHQPFRTVIRRWSHVDVRGEQAATPRSRAPSDRLRTSQPSAAWCYASPRSKSTSVRLSKPSKG